jgi:hypothetical protein
LDAVDKSISPSFKPTPGLRSLPKHSYINKEINDAVKKTMFYLPFDQQTPSFGKFQLPLLENQWRNNHLQSNLIVV